LNDFAKWDKVNCIEVVEINPCLDEKINRMAEVAYDILEEFTVHIQNRI
jgi:arginase